MTVTTHLNKTKSDLKSSTATSKNSGTKLYIPSYNTPYDRIIHLQQTIGNRGVGQLLSRSFLQANPKIGRPNDIYEQEADNIADQILGTPDPIIQGKPKDKTIQTKPIAEKVTPSVQKPVSNNGLDEASLQEDLQFKEYKPYDYNLSMGKLLSSSTRRYMEPRFGVDFGYVRVHSDNNARRTASQINARAYTYRHNIILGEGESENNKVLMAHELTHVLQQTNRSLNRSPMFWSSSTNKSKITKQNIHNLSSNPNHSLKAVNQISMVSPSIQRLERRVHFNTGEPDESDLLGPTRIFDYLNEGLTSRAHLGETRGLTQGRNIRVTGRASTEAPRNLSDPEQRDYNRRLSERRSYAVANYLQHSENPPWIVGWQFLGDIGAEANSATWRRVDVDISERSEVVEEGQGDCVTTGLAEQKLRHHRLVDSWRARYIPNMEANSRNARNANQRLIEFEESSIGQLRTVGSVGQGVAYLFGTPGAVVALCIIVLTEVAAQGLSGRSQKIAAAVAALDRRYQSALQEINDRHQELGQRIESITCVNSPEWGPLWNTIANLGVPEVTPENIIYRDLLLEYARGGDFNVSGSQWNVENMSLFGDAPWYHSWDWGSPGWTNGRDIAEELNNLAAGDPSTRIRVSINPP